MKINHLITAGILTLCSGYSAFAQVDLENNQPIQFKNNNGVFDGTSIYRANGDALRLHYLGNSLIMQGKDDKPVWIRDMNDNNKIQLHPNGDSWFKGGNVGIGTEDPKSKLDITQALIVRTAGVPRSTINGDEALRISGATSDYTISVQDGTGRVQHYWNSTTGSNPTFQVANEDAGKMMFSPDKNSLFEILWADGSMANANDPITWESKFRVQQNGNVAIGVPGQTFNYKLAVNGTIGTKEVVVENTSAWPDYVFAPDYKLTDLSVLEEYIKKNQHLPGIPSAQEVEENGVALGEMNKLLLEKVEELTLHLIEQNSLNKKQAKRLEKLEKQVEALKEKK